MLTSGLLGCTHVDPALARSEKAAAVLAGSRQSIQQGEQTVADSQAALRALQNSTGDLRPPFQAFLVQVSAVRKQADRMKLDGDVVRTQTAAYCAARQSDVATIANDDMRKLAEERTAHVKQECDDIKDRYARVNVASNHYIRSLADLQTYLANELNYGSVRTGQKWFDEAISAGERLRGDVRALALKVELTSNLLSPAPMAVTQWPSTLRSGDATSRPE